MSSCISTSVQLCDCDLSGTEPSKENKQKTNIGRDFSSQSPPHTLFLPSPLERKIERKFLLGFFFFVTDVQFWNWDSLESKLED